MLHKIVETGKTDDKCYNILKYSCYACYQDYSFSFFAKLDMLITTIGIIFSHRDRHVGYHIWDRNCYDLKELQFSLKGPGITPI